ncbi:glycine--tRNA ligase subunit beta, partial [candidate division WOR-3 bacterium]|nr:glycine--tRNA ligase subunit beta [candidate division WOR-3 bacterium]
YFVAVTNTPGCDHARVRAWYEKAVDSRLKDARFFVEADLKLGLEPLVEEEKRVTWVEGMGTLFDKTGRLRRLCAYLASVVPGVAAKALDRAAQLCKADLLTQVIREKEFTSLQGIMGGIYASRLGEDAEVSLAVTDHYLPRFTGDRLPGTIPASLLSIADKTDNIAAAFASGAVPTGSEDPFALRRQATAILSVILELKLPVDVSELLTAAAGLFAGAAPGALPDFFRERMAALLSEKSIRYDVAGAVLATNWHTPAEALTRAQALTQLRSRAEFEKLVIGQKRVANILKGLTVEGLPEDALFSEPTEKLLWTEARKAEPDLDRALATADYAGALGLLLGLRPTIDRLFDDVLVMDKDAKVRDNRLRLVLYVRSLFLKVADLSQIVLEGESGEPGK